MVAPHFGSSSAGPVGELDDVATGAVEDDTTIGVSTCTFSCFTQTQPTAPAPPSKIIAEKTQRSADVRGGRANAGVAAVGGISVALGLGGRGFSEATSPDTCGTADEPDVSGFESAMVASSLSELFAGGASDA